jgi:hypothetical protein
MTDFPDDFDVSGQVPESGGFDPLPAGVYKLQIIEASIEDMKSGNGQFLKLTLEVTDGPFANRKLWENLNLWHTTSAQAVDIAQRAQAALLTAMGIARPSQIEDLCFHPFAARVLVKDNNDGYGPKNLVRPIAKDGRAPASRAAPAQATRPSPQAAQKPTQAQPRQAQGQQNRPAPSGGTKPWTRGKAAAPAADDDEIPF